MEAGSSQHELLDGFVIESALVDALGLQVSDQVRPAPPPNQRTHPLGESAFGGAGDANFCLF